MNHIFSQFQQAARLLGVRWWTAVLVLALACLLVKARAADDASFTRGVESARAGQLSEAGHVFEKSVQARPSAGGFVNLGITEWQRGHAGAAILAWERATWLDPHDARAVQNLKFARAAVQVDEPELRWFETASTWLPANLWLWLAGMSLWLALGALVLPSVFRRRKSGWQQSLAALGLCAFIFSVTANVGVVSRTDIGFVLKKNVPLRLTPTSGSEVTSILSAGEPVRRLKTRGNYFFIRTSVAAGWIEQGQIGLINE
ncbi:MAG TPA: hypothetical protein VG347_01960 [Verrucomicrobiae bacterium]|nr:hypothetical protein [Verrucomicrobiae bacterium]